MKPNAATRVMEVRLDARTTNPEETRALGIEVGDFVAFDPRVELTNGFVRSRHLDDKACVACILAAVKALHDAGVTPAAEDLPAYLQLRRSGPRRFRRHPGRRDRAAVGGYGRRGRRSELGRVSRFDLPQRFGRPVPSRADPPACATWPTLHEIDYRADIYPYYGSDGEAFWRAGGDVAVALIGPGVDASHNYERTHTEALVATTRWIVAFLMSA